MKHMIDYSEIVLEFLQKEGTDYALMLTGTWGSGKTFYVKNELKKIIEKNGYKIVYISLNGINDPQKVIDTVLAELLTEKIGKSTTDVLSIGAQVLMSGISLSAGIFSLAAGQSNNSIQSIKKSIIQKVLPKFKNTLFVFDDLERISDLELVPEFIGSIHRNFIEHNSAKVLLISNEEELMSGQYPRIKEKTIGRVIHFKNEPYDLISNFIQTIKIEELKSFLGKERQILIGLFTKHAQGNIRTLKFILDSFCGIFQNAKSVKGYNLILPQVLYFTAIISLEFKKGDISSKDEEEQLQLDNMILPAYLMSKKDVKFTKEEEYLIKFYKNYIKHSDIEYLYFPSILKYILTGYLDSNSLLEEIKKNLERDDEKVKAFNKITRFEEIEYLDLQEAYNTILKFAEDGDLFPADYLTLWGRAEILKNHKILNIEVNKDYQKIIKGLKKCLGNMQEVPIRTSRQKYGSKKMQSIQDILIKHNQFRSEISLEKAVHDFLDSLSDAREALNKFSSISNIFQSVKIKDFAENLLKLDNNSITNFGYILNERYLSVSNAGDVYSDEVHPIEELIESLKVRIKPNKLDPLRKYVLDKFMDTLSETKDHIIKTRPINIS